MNCDDVRSAIYVYLDGEFAAPEEAEFERHLDGCPHCRRTVERESVFLAELKSNIETPAVPTELRVRIESQLAEIPAPGGVGSGRRYFWAAAVPVALAACVTLAVVYYGRTAPVEAAPVAPETVDTVAREAVRAHAQDLPMEVRGSDTHIRSFVEENVDFAVEIPLSNDPEVKLVGARLAQVDGRSAVIFNYETESGERLSVVQRPSSKAPAPERAKPEVAAHEGYRVMTFEQRGVKNAVVGNVAESQMMRLVPASHRR